MKKNRLDKKQFVCLIITNRFEVTMFALTTPKMIHLPLD